MLVSETIAKLITVASNITVTTLMTVYRLARLVVITMTTGKLQRTLTPNPKTSFHHRSSYLFAVKYLLQSHMAVQVYSR